MRAVLRDFGRGGRAGFWGVGGDTWKALGLWIPHLALVNIGWAFKGGGEGEREEVLLEEEEGGVERPEGDCMLE